MNISLSVLFLSTVATVSLSTEIDRRWVVSDYLFGTLKKLVRNGVSVILNVISLVRDNGGVRVVE